MTSLHRPVSRKSVLERHLDARDALGVSMFSDTSTFKKSRYDDSRRVYNSYIKDVRKLVDRKRGSKDVRSKEDRTIIIS